MNATGMNSLLRREGVNRIQSVPVIEDRQDVLFSSEFSGAPVEFRKFRK